jgi:uncharacterized membrane protein YeaQ/YmgE (transglycosylase-associated protein family)
VALCFAVGSTLGGLVPEAWGASGLGVTAILGSVIGAVVGVWAAARISESI